MRLSTEEQHIETDNHAYRLIVFWDRGLSRLSVSNKFTSPVHLSVDRSHPTQVSHPV